MTQLEVILIGAFGTVGVGIAGFAARILWWVIPRQMAQNERSTKAIEWASYTLAWLPHTLAANELRFEAALSRGLNQLQAASSAESEKTRLIFEAMMDKMTEAIERRLSGQEHALHETTVEMARATGSTTGSMKAAGAGATGKLAAVPAPQAEAVLEAEDSTRPTLATLPGVGGRPGSGTRPAVPAG